MFRNLSIGAAVLFLNVNCKPRSYNDGSETQKVGLELSNGTIVEFKNLGNTVSIRLCKKDTVPSSKPCALASGYSENTVSTELLRSHLKATLHVSNFSKTNLEMKEKVQAYEKAQGDEWQAAQLKKEIERLRGFLSSVKKVKSSASGISQVESKLENLENVQALNQSIDGLVDELMKTDQLRGLWVEKENQDDLLFQVLFSYVKKSGTSSSANTSSNDAVLGKFVVIPATGDKGFMMGNPNSDKEAGDNERPRHKVILTESFEMMETEVTQKMWVDNGFVNNSRFKGDTLPVETVSWEEVKTFINKLNTQQKTYKYALPTEAQWEYAARGGKEEIYPGGSASESSLKEYAVYNSGQTQPVKGNRKPNGFGLYDTSGNVWEWTQDWYSDTYYNTPEATKPDPKGPTSSNFRVFRGGSWFNDAGGVRVAFRGGGIPGYRYDDVGFRLLRTK